MKEGDWKILQWLGSHRLIAGPVTLAVFCYGLYACWPSISQELPRFDPWQRWLLWIGDLSAVIAIIPWMFRPDQTTEENRHGERSTQPGLRSVVQRATIVMSIAIAVDLAITCYGFASERHSSLRSVSTTATVTNATSRVVNLARPKTYYTVEFGFQDQAGQHRSGRLEFSHNAGDSWTAWQKQLLAVFEKNQKTIAIRYDPSRPDRYWAKDQAWVYGARLAGICMMVHLFQISMLGGFVYHVLVEKSPEAYTSQVSQAVPALPLMVEAICLVFLGTAALYLGSLV